MSREFKNPIQNGCPLPMKPLSAYGTAFEMIEEVEKEFAKTSDLGAAIASSAFLEAILREILVNFLATASAKEDESLFDGFGPLATFRARIDLSFRLSLVSDQEYRMLNAIRAIRNAFAHDLRVKFKTPLVKDRCRTLEIPDSMVIPKLIPLRKSEKHTVPLPRLEKPSLEEPRLVFQESVINLVHRLAARSIQATVQQRKHKPNFTIASEPGRIFIDSWKNQMDRLERLKGRVKELRRRGQSETADEIEVEMNEIVEEKKRWEPLIRLEEYCLGQIDAAHAAKEKGS